MKKWFGLVILILLISSLIGCSVGNGLTPSHEAEKFVGFWVNEDKDTMSITKIDVTKAGNTILVNMWGKCEPEDCDWGIATTDVSDAEDGILNLTWDHGFAIVTQRLFLLSDGRLKVITFTDFHENDKYHRQDYEHTEYFIKKF